jgi:hypothetical protein
MQHHSYYHIVFVTLDSGERSFQEEKKEVEGKEKASK